MPILVMAMLALVVFGLIGIMLVVAVMMEHSEPPRPARLNAVHPVPPEIIPPFNPNADEAHGEDAPATNPSTKEKVHEHACT